MDRLEDDAARPLWVLSTMAFVAMGSMPQGILMGFGFLAIYILLYGVIACWLGMAEDTLMHWYWCTLVGGVAAFLVTILARTLALPATIVVLVLVWIIFLRS